MATFTPSNAACHIYTFKKGLLSVLAHDLKLRVSLFEIKVTGAAKDGAPWRSIQATFNAASVRTVCSMKDGKKSPAVLSANDRKDVDRNIASAVLRPVKFPMITFRSKSISGGPGGLMITGELTLCGVTRALVLPVKRSKDGHRVNVKIDQRDFGITPFSALMGAIQVRPEILVRIETKCG